MRILMVLVTAVLTLALLAGCSDKQKEAAELEQEMRDLEAADTATGTDSASDMTVQESVADAEAIPDEAQPDLLSMPPVPVGEGYTVQVASCEDRNYAQHLVGVYADRGYDAFVTTITYEGQTYNRVRIGNFGVISEARALERELQDKFSATTWIDRLDQ
ncbi:MAG: SPOR domain-containing protein [candidate division Zixibacteria bacterium]|nr:SPOR domain-containing protein [candidate division Zixibacteria bacterium]